MKLTFKPNSLNCFVLARNPATMLQIRNITYQNIPKSLNNAFRNFVSSSVMSEEGKINGKRGRGRPITSWVNNIVKWTGLDYPSVVRTAQDRHRWKAVSSDPLTVDGT